MDSVRVYAESEEDRKRLLSIAVQNTYNGSPLRNIINKVIESECDHLILTRDRVDRCIKCCKSW